MVLLGLSRGLVGICVEIVFASVSEEISYGTDIGLLTTGFHIGRAISQAIAGFIIAFYGFSIPFIVSALFLFVFSLFSSIILGRITKLS